MCGLFPCIPIFGGIFLIKKYYGIGGLIFCVKLIRQITAIHTTFLVRISLYLVQKQENRDQKNSIFGHFSRNEKAISAKGFIKVGSILGVRMGTGIRYF